MNFRIDSRIAQWLWSRVRGYDHDKYWSRRQKVVDPNSGTPIWLKLYYLYYIKKTDARHGCSFGTALNSGAQFAEPPVLLHGPNGIIVGHDAMIGRHVTILHQVTIEHGGGMVLS